MGRSNEGRKSSRNLKQGKRVEPVKTLKPVKVIDATSTTIFSGCATGGH